MPVSLPVSVSDFQAELWIYIMQITLKLYPERPSLPVMNGFSFLFCENESIFNDPSRMSAYWSFKVALCLSISKVADFVFETSSGQEILSLV